MRDKMTLAEIAALARAGERFVGHGSVAIGEGTPKYCPRCGVFAVVPLTPEQLAIQPDTTTHVCHPLLGGCNLGYGPGGNDDGR